MGPSIVEKLCEPRDTTTYAYDRAGNRIEHSNPNSYAYYTYNQANQLISKTENEQETTFSYDASGNLTGEQLWGEPLYTYAYNDLDRLKEATSSANGITNTYTYDALGRRIARIQGTAVRNHHQFAASDLDDYITDESGELFAALTRGTDGLATYTAFTAGGAISGYHIYNPHGDTSAITQADGSVWFDYSYDAFGNALGNEGLAYDYAGKWERERDGLTGMVQMGVRDYDPKLGRFTSTDMLKGNRFNPQTRNQYQYALNNPKVTYDLNGKVPAVIVAGGAAFVAVEGVSAVYAYENNTTVTEANERVMEDMWEGVEATTETAWGDMEWVGSQANDAADWIGTRLFGDDEATKCTSQTPPLELDDVMAGGLNIYFEDANEPLLGKNAKKSKNRTNTDLAPDSSRATAKTVFRKLTEGQRIKDTTKADGTKIRIAEDGTTIRFSPDGKTRIDIPGRGPAGRETIHFNP